MRGTPSLVPHAGEGRDPRAAAAAYRASRIRGKRILCVDDSILIRQATGAMLVHAGAACLLADTHDQAIAFVIREPGLALAILDFQMPDGDVGRLIQRIRTVRAALPLIGTSAMDRRQEFAERGVIRFLEKPWRPEDLVREMNW